MQKQAGRILTALVAIGTISSMAYGITNPLKSYDLYADSHRNSDSERENVMSEYYSNSLSASYKKNNPPAVNSLPELPSTTPDYDKDSSGTVRRNAYLRESSKHVYANSEEPAWTKSQSFYENPSLGSIKAKYKKSDFAGCMQECESYVKKHPNDTLGFYYLAMCYTKVNDKENAIKAYEKVIALNSNPMIVKYATNGRNCVMQGSDTCYEDVNVPELIYPYANVTAGQNLTPVDPNTLIQRNMDNLYNSITPLAENSSGPQSKNGEKQISLPFGNQDEDLDAFINSPYGNGLSPKLNKEYEGQQLKKLQDTINDSNNNPDRNIQNIKNFDNSKSDSGSIKLAYDSEQDVNQRELRELNMLFGSSDSNQDLLLNYLNEKGENLSPEVIQALMIKSMMPDFTFVNSDSKNLL